MSGSVVVRRAGMRACVRVAALAAGWLLLASAAFAEDPMGMQPPSPGPQHKLLASRIGTWKATVKMYIVPGAPPMVMEGTETIRALVGGTWFVSEFHSEQPMPFEGIGTEGWDAKKGKYVGTWTDSWSPGFQSYEGPESDGKSLTTIMTGPGMSGEMETTTMVETLDDANHRTTKSYRGPDASGDPIMTIDYSRAAAKSSSETGKGHVHHGK